MRKIFFLSLTQLQLISLVAATRAVQNLRFVLVFDRIVALNSYIFCNRTKMWTVQILLLLLHL